MEMTVFGISVLGYIGPGPGLSMLGALIGLIVTVVAAIGAVLAWPLRALLSNSEDDEGEGDESTEGAEAEETNDEVSSDEQPEEAEPAAANAAEENASDVQARADG